MSRLQSELFRGDPRLEQTLVNDAAHVVLGNHGEFVSKIQYAVLVLEGGQIGHHELQKREYGVQTAKAVLAYKARRNIINKAYQQTADNIVGKMTISSLDAEMVIYEYKDRMAQHRHHH